MTHRPVDVARAFVEAFGRRDMATVARYVADDIAFGTLRAADHLVVRDGKIHSDALVFDTYEVRKAETR